VTRERELHQRLAALEKALARVRPKELTDEDLIAEFTAGTATMDHVHTLFTIMGEELRATVMISAAQLRWDPRRVPGYAVCPVYVAMYIVSYPARDPVPELYLAQVFECCGHDPELWDLLAKKFYYSERARPGFFRDWVRAEMIRLLFKDDPTGLELRTQLDEYSEDMDALKADFPDPPPDFARRLLALDKSVGGTDDTPLIRSPPAWERDIMFGCPVGNRYVLGDY
jgi:hypothetical protein